MGKSIIGQEAVVERLIIGLLANGNLLVEGLPGLAKTRAIKALAKNLEADFSRIQFTPDLLPSDVTGTEVYYQSDSGSEFRFEPGPIFANIVLGDEINRAPAKVQAAMLEAMEERQVTVAGKTHKMPPLFMVMATQNPVEQEGTYPLPEAQVDRFMLKLSVGYPSRDEELEIMQRMAAGPAAQVQPVVNPDEIIRARKAVEMIYMDPQVERYIVDLVFATRDPVAAGLNDLEALIAFGASPRASISLARGARAHAFLKRRGFVTPEDVRAVGLDVLRHRVLLTYEAEAEEVTSEDVVSRILNTVEVP